MIGDTYRLYDGAVVKVHHYTGRDGLVHAALSVDGDRMYAPQHVDGPNSPLFHANETEDEVLTCLVCTTHIFENSPVRVERNEWDSDSDAGGYIDDDD
jgi:hypothetical protein